MIPGSGTGAPGSVDGTGGPGVGPRMRGGIGGGAVGERSCTAFCGCGVRRSRGMISFVASDGVATLPSYVGMSSEVGSSGISGAAARVGSSLSRRARGGGTTLSLRERPGWLSGERSMRS